MTSAPRPGWRPRPGAPRRAAAVLVTAAVCATPALLWTQPANGAEPGEVTPTVTTTPTPSDTPTATPTATPTPTPTASPGVSTKNGFVYFQIPAATLEAAVGPVSSVVVEGDLAPGANVAELGMGRNGDAWTSSIGPLAPGVSRSRFRADDTKVVADATNPAVVASDPTWRTVLVPGVGAELLADAPAGKGGRLATVTYTGGTASVWTPPGYDAKRATAYPVLYLLAPTEGGPGDWAQLGRAKQILDNLTLAGKAEPMVVAMSATGADGLAVLSKAIRGRFNVAAEPERQAVAGAAAGATQALTLGLSRPGTVGYVGSFGATADAVLSANGLEVNASTKLLRLYTGNVTDPAYNPTFRLLRQLDKAGVRREFDGVNPDAGGTWTAWRENLADFVPRLFRPVADHGVSTGHLPLRREFTPPAPGSTPSPFMVKDDNGDGFLTIDSPAGYADAKHITLWGNWAPNGSWVNVEMTRVGDRWRATVGPLKPWLYYYKFLIDLQSVKDPANPSKVTTEPSWSTVLVTGGRSRLLADASKGGKVSTLTYDSAVAGEKRSAYVWTPPGYDAKRATRYPVLYLQHGGGQNYTDWLEMGRAKQILDNLFRDHAIVPMVVVMGNGNVPDFTAELRENLAPAARKAYNIASDPAHQALAGLSMGGFQTYWLLRDHPGEFAWIGTFSAAIGFPGQPMDGAGYDAAAINAGTTLLQVYVGNETDFVHPFATQTMAVFDKIGVKYAFAGETPGPHGWDAWQKNLIDFAPRLFK